MIQLGGRRHHRLKFRFSQDLEALSWNFGSKRGQDDDFIGHTLQISES